MSVFIVSDIHINSLLTYLKRKSVTECILIGKRQFSLFHFNDLTDLARILLAENYRSYNSRYGDEHAEPHDILYTTGKQTLSSIEALKACSCYDYQACETDDYYESDAYRIISIIRSLAITNLPGYKEAPWEIEA